MSAGGYRSKVECALWRGGLVLILVLAVRVGGAVAAQPAGNDKPAPYKAALLMEAASGKVLFAYHAQDRRPPASMVKMMLALIVAEEVKEGRQHWDDPVRASRWASKMGGSQVYLREGEVFSLAEMMQAVIIHSANDAAVAIAEAVAGTAPAFVELMNARARRLGLKDTEYHSVHGLPPGRGQRADVTTAHDLAVLARELVKFPEILGWSKMTEASFRDGEFRLINTNRLVRTANWVDGLKTGYFRRAGFNVTATGEQNGLRLIAVVLGVPTKGGCFDAAAGLLSSGYARYTKVSAVRKGAAVGTAVRVRSGNPGFVRVVAGAGLTAVVEKDQAPVFNLELVLPVALEAPLAPAAEIGEIVVKNGEQEVGRVPALTAEGVKREESLWQWLF